MHDLLAYAAIVISLVAVSMKKMLPFRIMHLTASMLYLVYGLKIDSDPIALGGLLFGIIHIYRMRELYIASKKAKNELGSDA